MSRDKKDERPLAYPKPTETDQQLKNQPEYIDQQPGDFSDKSISNMPAVDEDLRQSNNPREEEK
ncbi:MAG TPA: hypothetical protein VFR58_09060 [Flavisolibacter sp.]|nr:hypothetical protein [Flavisolibacter sp.]